MAESLGSADWLRPPEEDRAGVEVKVVYLITSI